MLLRFASCVVLLVGGAASCVTDVDCNLNGVCGAAGACACAAAWTGDTCGVLNLHPARPSPGAGYDEANSSSWGGSIVADPDDGGKWHMFVSRMEGHCGLNAWQQNSQIIRAEASDPGGPYTNVETILPHFAHGPSVRRLPDGSYIMMHLGCGRPFVPFTAGCTNGWTPGKQQQQQQQQQQHADADPAPLCNQFNVSVMTAPKPTGPWSASTQVFLSDGAAAPAAASWFVPSGRQFSNPAPHVLANGSLLCAFRADARSGGEHVSVALAAGPLGPYVDRRPHAAVASHSGEDPYLWQDERGHWHMLMHNMGGSGGVGSHAYSADAVTWVRSGVAPYNATVSFVDGSAKKMRRRERPQLLLDGAGRPLYFTTGVEDVHDHTYTLVIKVHT